MKRLLLIPLVFLLASCMTQYQKESEANYYTMLSKIATAYQAQPVFRITPAVEGKAMVFDNVRSIEVFSPPPPLGDFARQYQHRDFTPGWVNTALQAAMPLGILYGGSLLLREGGGGGTTYNVNGGSSVKSAGTILNDSVSQPTVVFQPEPKVVIVPSGQ